MTDRHVIDCLEANAYYNGCRKYRDNPALAVIAEAYLMRAETLTKERA
jgi:hypothetical protein